MRSSLTRFRADFFKILAAILLLLEIQPYFIWGVTGTRMLLTITIPLIIIIGAHYQGKNIVSAIIFACIALFAAVAEGDNFYGCISMMTVAILFLSVDYLKDVYSYFKTIYVYLIGLSSIVWVLVMVGVSLPVHEIMPLNTLKDITYHQYPFLVMMGYDPDFSIYRAFRFCGPFDEPGVVGTNALLILLIERFNIRKASNIIILISGLISMSLFFYVSIIIYMIYFFTLKEGNVKTKILSIVLFSALTILSYNYEVTRSAIWERLEYDKTTRTFVGNNRAEDELKQYVSRIRGSDEYWFGVHNKAVIERFSGSASVQNAILKYGMFGVFIYSLFFVVYAFKRIPKRKEAFFCIMFLFITLWQRPGLYNIPYVFMYIMLIEHFRASHSLLYINDKEKVLCCN